MNALNLTDIEDLKTVNAEVGINGALYIDQNVTIGSGLNFSMWDNSWIIVNNGVSFTKNGGYIEACNGDWNGITSSDGAVTLSRTRIDGATTALALWGSWGSVRETDLLDCGTGIYMNDSPYVGIEYSTIEYESFGIRAYNESHFDVQHSDIGTATVHGQFGIWSDNCTSFVYDNPNIIANYRAISVVGGSSNIMNNPNIEVTGPDNYATGIASFISHPYIDNNVINGNDLYAGIWQNSNTEHNIVTHNIINDDFDYGILVQASNDQLCSANIIAGARRDGISVQDSDDNIFECNEISADDYGINIRPHSDLQALITNDFVSAGEADLLLQEPIGEQDSHGNKEWNVVLGIGDGEQNLFRDDPDKFPPVKIPGNLFLPGGTSECHLTPGTYNTFNIEFPCWYLNYIQQKRASNPNYSWIASYQLLRRYLLKVPRHLWPDCVEVWPPVIPECGLKDLASMDAAYRATLEQNTVDLSSVEEAYDLSSESITEPNNTYKQQRRTVIHNNQQRLDQLITEQSRTLDSIPCEDELYVLWQSVYRLLLKRHSAEMNEADLTLLKSTAELCPAEYGDVVHWATGLLTSYHTNIQFEESACMEVIEPRERKQTNESVEVYPNPAQSELNIITPESALDDMHMKMYSSRGEVIGNYRLKAGKNTIQLSPAITDGLYILRINGGHAISYTKKLVIHRK